AAWTAGGSGGERQPVEPRKIVAVEKQGVEYLVEGRQEPGIAAVRFHQRVPCELGKKYGKRTGVDDLPARQGPQPFPVDDAPRDDLLRAQVEGAFDRVVKIALARRE